MMSQQDLQATWFKDNPNYKVEFSAEKCTATCLKNERRALAVQSRAITGVKPMIDYYHADKYTAEVRAIFDEFARTFAEIMLPFVQRFGADTLVVGGGMVRAEEFFFPQLRAAFEQKGVQIPVVAMADTTTAIIAGAAALCK